MGMIFFLRFILFGAKQWHVAQQHPLNRKKKRAHTNRIHLIPCNLGDVLLPDFKRMAENTHIYKLLYTVHDGFSIYFGAWQFIYHPKFQVMAIFSPGRWPPLAWRFPFGAARSQGPLWVQHPSSFCRSPQNFWRSTRTFWRSTKVSYISSSQDEEM